MHCTHKLTLSQDDAEYRNSNLDHKATVVHVLIEKEVLQRILSVSQQFKRVEWD